MGNNKNKQKPANPKLIAKTQKNMERDAEELSGTDEEIHANITTPAPPPPASGSQMRPRDIASDEDEDDEDDISGERPAGERQS